MNKIFLSKNLLKKEILKLKKKSKRIVLVHGVFDVVHLGHIYYFQEAKSYGDILVASITSDRFVNKGLNKPYFSEKDRLTFLSQLSIVDYVYFNDTKDASLIIKTIKPDYYVKGPDYKTKKGDEAGNLGYEMNALKKANGKFITTSNVQYSSTKIINKKLNFYNLQDNYWLKKIKIDSSRNNYLNEFNKVLDKVKKQKILLLGEVIFDEYNYVDPLGKPSKENILSVNFSKKETFFGGCLPVAKNIAQICKSVTIVSYYNKKHNLNKIKNFFKDDKIKLNFIKKEGYLDIVKRRYLNSKNFSKIFEVYNFVNNDFYDQKLYNYLSKNLKKFDKVIVCDFGHGLINDKIAKLLSINSKFISANIQTNSGNRGFNLFDKYKKLDFLLIDEPELRLGVKDRNTSVDKIIKNLAGRNYKKIMITRGVEGLNYKDDNNFVYIPALTKSPLDTIGAGDAAYSFASCFVKNTKNSNLISLVAAIAGALKVQIVGHKDFIKLNDVFLTLRSLLK